MLYTYLTSLPSPSLRLLNIRKKVNPIGKLCKTLSYLYKLAKASAVIYTCSLSNYQSGINIQCHYSTKIGIPLHIWSYKQGSIERRAQAAHTPFIFCRGALDFLWVPQAKRMNQIMWIDFYKLHFFLWDTLLSLQLLKFCQSLIGTPSVKKKKKKKKKEKKKSWICPW